MFEMEPKAAFRPSRLRRLDGAAEFRGFLALKFRQAFLGLAEQRQLRDRSPLRLRPRQPIEEAVGLEESVAQGNGAQFPWPGLRGCVPRFVRVRSSETPPRIRFTTSRLWLCPTTSLCT